jgi:inner membrane protein involved in colicin E2 resistance
MSELTNIDYKKILEFYNKPIPKSKRLLKAQAEKLIVSKLCRCIKKVDKENETRAIGICTKTIINSKGLIRGKFTCKKRQEINLKKKNNITKKSRK